MRKHRLDSVGLVAKGKVDAAANRLRDARQNEAAEPVSYTHLTLPTKA